VFVAVVVDGDGRAGGCPYLVVGAWLRVAEVGPGEVEPREDVVRVAVGVAVQDDGLVASGPDGQAGLAVVVGRAAGHESGAGFLDGFEAGQHQLAHGIDVAHSSQSSQDMTGPAGRASGSGTSAHRSPLSQVAG
jgi:hypothetical protein